MTNQAQAFLPPQTPGHVAKSQAVAGASPAAASCGCEPAAALGWQA